MKSIIDLNKAILLKRNKIHRLLAFAFEYFEEPLSKESSLLEIKKEAYFKGIKEAVSCAICEIQVNNFSIDNQKFYTEEFYKIENEKFPDKMLKYFDESRSLEIHHVTIGESKSDLVIIYLTYYFMGYDYATQRMSSIIRNGVEILII